MKARGIGHPIPGCAQKRDLVQPYPMTKGVNENQHANLKRHGVAYPKSGLDCGVECWHVFAGNDSPVYKTLHYGPRSLVHNNFGANENWQRDQKPYMGLKVPKKTEVTVAEQLPAVQAE